MKKLIWLTDIHLNFLPFETNQIFLNRICQMINVGDSVVITGDIAEGPSVRLFMTAWKTALEGRGAKLYFVFGNHDFYNDSIKRVREATRDTLGASWLPEGKVIDLGQGVDALVGHDGWYDGLYANWMKSKVWLNDYECIRELGPVYAPTRQEKLKKIQALSREGAEHVKLHANLAAKTFKRVFIATHVPPFREAAVYAGKISDDDWMPHFSSKLMGDAILKVAQDNPEVEFVVLCGHSHGQATISPAKNVTCHTGFAEYRQTNIANVFTLNDKPVHT